MVTAFEKMKAENAAKFERDLNKAIVKKLKERDESLLNSFIEEINAEREKAKADVKQKRADKKKANAAAEEEKKRQEEAAKAANAQSNFGG